MTRICVIKFSNLGRHVAFEVSTLPSTSGEEIQMLVKDCGKGVARNHIAGTLFTKHMVRGLILIQEGLGLAIASKPVQKH